MSVLVPTRGRKRRKRIRNKNSISVSEFPDFKQLYYIRYGGGETFTCRRKFACVTILFFEGARGGVGFCGNIYIIYNNIIIYYSYIIYVVHSKPTHRSRNVRVVCVDEGRV